MAEQARSTQGGLSEGQYEVTVDGSVQATSEWEKISASEWAVWSSQEATVRGLLVNVGYVSVGR